MTKEKWDYNWQERECFVEIDFDIFESLSNKQKKEFKKF